MIRKILFGLFAVLIITGAAVATLLLTVKPNDLKRVLQQEVMAKTGRQLIIHGDMHWRFWPELGFSARSVSLRDDSEFHRGELLSIGKMRMSISPLDLVRHRLELKELVLSNVKLNWLRRKNGRINLNVLLGDIRRASFNDQNDISSSWQFSMHRIEINNASMDIIDRHDRFHVRLTHINARLGNLLVDQSRHLSFNFHYNDGKRVFYSHGEGDFRVTPDWQQWSLSGLKQQAIFKGELAKQGINALKVETGVIYDSHQHLLSFRPFSVRVNQQSPLNGQFVLNLSKQPTHLSFSLSSNHLQLPAGLTLLNRIALYHGPAFKKIHAQGQFKANQVEIGKLHFGNLLTDIELSGGSLKLKQVTSDFYNGNLTASGSLDLARTHARVKMETDFVGVSVSKLIKNICDIQKPVTGTLRISTQLEGVLPIDHFDQLEGRLQANLSQSLWSGVDLSRGALRGMTHLQDLNIRVHLDNRQLLWDSLSMTLKNGAVFQGKGEWTANRHLRVHLKSDNRSRMILFSRSCYDPIEQITRR